MGKKARERRERMVWAKNQMVRESVIADARLFDYLRLDGGRGFPELSDMPLIVADEIQQAVEQPPEHMWTNADFKNIAPPFDNEFFIETKASIAGIPAITGVHFVVGDKELSDDISLSDNKNIPPDWFDKERVARWGCFVEGYIAMYIHGKFTVFHLPVTGLIYVSPKGEYIGSGALNDKFVLFTAVHDDEVEICNRAFSVDWGAHMYGKLLSMQMPAKLLALQLMNCRNVKLVDNEPDAEKSRIYERHFGQPLTKYKTLAIKPIGKRYESDEEQPYQGIMPLHIRRGHFATYTEDAPLFGKYTGTFWRPATVVGEQDNGVVVKDYEVKP